MLDQVFSTVTDLIAAAFVKTTIVEVSRPASLIASSQL